MSDPVPIVIPGQERKSGRRWLMIGLALTLVTPLLLLGMAYAVLRCGPIPRFSTVSGWELTDCQDL